MPGATGRTTNLIMEKTPDKREEGGFNKELLSNREISTFCSQIAMIMKSGIPVSEGISIMVEDMKNPQGRAVLETIAAHLETGGAFHAALAATNKFPRYVLDMAELGERTGRLDNVMSSLDSYYEREEAISKNIRSAVTYPMVMITMMLLVIIILVVEVLPLFAEVFVLLGREMNEFSAGMIRMGQVLSQYSVFFIGFFALLVAAFLFMRYTKAGRGLLQKIKLNFFVTKRLMSKIASGRFASAMAMTLASGLDVDQSLEMATKLVDNPNTHAQIAACKEFMLNGDSFSNALVKSDIFTGVYARMISVGFKTGSVDTIMSRISEMYDEEIQNRINSIISVLEPTLVAVLSTIMGMILLSVMMPLMGIMTSMG